MAKSKKVDIFGLLMFLFILVSLALIIVGICIEWTASTTTVIGESNTVKQTLADISKSNANAVKLSGSGLKGYDAMAAFTYMTLVLSILTAIVAVISRLAKIKFLKWLLFAVSLLLIASAIAAIATTYSFCSNFGGDAVVASSKLSPAAGPWLLTVFAAVCGFTGMVGSFKK